MAPIETNWGWGRMHVASLLQKHVFEDVDAAWLRVTTGQKDFGVVLRQRWSKGGKALVDTK